MKASQTEIVIMLTCCALQSACYSPTGIVILFILAQFQREVQTNLTVKRAKNALFHRARRFRMPAACALGIFSGKIIYNFAFVALCGALQTHFHGRGVATANGSCSAAFCESAALRNTIFSRENGIAERPQVFRYPGLIKLFCAQRKHHCAGTSFLRSRNLMPAGHIIPFLPGLPPGLRWRLRRRLLPSRPAARR